MDLLILNPYNPEFYYVPVGTFAIADHLAREGFQARILNLALYAPGDVEQRIRDALARFRPRNVGLILHWKEMFNAFMATGALVRELSPETRIVAGGITASHFARPLLERAWFLDGVVQGDAEAPLLQFVREESPTRVENLWFKDGAEPVAPQRWWTADAGFLNGLRYGDLSALMDHELYLEKVGQRLGFPLAPGRGCSFNCGYCGGARDAFKSHSHRAHMALRDPEVVLADLEEATRHGANTFLLSHIPAVCRRVLEAIRRRHPSGPPFTLHLESWALPEQDLLELYAETTRPPAGQVRHLLITLRGHERLDHREEERQTASRVVQRMSAIDPTVHVTVFSSYFAPWHSDAIALDEELEYLAQMRREHRSRSASFALMALSTDPASPWSEGDGRVEVHLGLPDIAAGALLEHTVQNNLLLHRPRPLPVAAEQSFLRTWHLDGALFDASATFWYALRALLSSPELRSLLDDAASGLYEHRSAGPFPLQPLSRRLLLGVLRASLRKLATGTGGPADFLSDLAAVMNADALPIRPTNSSSRALPTLLLLHPDRVYPSPWRFDFVEDEKHGPPSDAAILRAYASLGSWWYLLGSPASGALPESEIDLLRRFDGLRPTRVVVDELSGRLCAPPAAVEGRIHELVASGVLVADSGFAS